MLNDSDWAKRLKKWVKMKRTRKGILKHIRLVRDMAGMQVYGIFLAIELAVIKYILEYA